MTIKQLSIFVENKKGKIAQVAGSISKAGIDIRALSVADTQGFGILRLIVSDTQKAKDILRMNNCVVSITEVIGVEIPDEPGSLARILTLLDEREINLEYIYAFISVSGKNAYVVLRVTDNEKAINELTKAGIKLITQTEIENL